MEKPQPKFDEETYRKQVIALSEIGKFVKDLEVPELTEMKMFILHDIQVLGGLLRDLHHVVDLIENPMKISTEVTPRERGTKPTLTVPVEQKS